MERRTIHLIPEEKIPLNDIRMLPKPQEKGAGVFGPGTKYSKLMGIYPSVFQAEMNAIGRCTQLNLDRNYRTH